MYKSQEIDVCSIRIAATEHSSEEIFGQLIVGTLYSPGLILTQESRQGRSHQEARAVL